MLRHWKYRNLTIILVGLILAFFLSRSEIFRFFLLNLGAFGYLGAFVAGLFFVFTFTITTSILVLLILAETLSPLKVGLIAGCGAVLGDLIIFRLIRKNLPLNHHHQLKKLWSSKYFNWVFPVLGALIIVSPLPDELGVSLMGLSQISSSKFILLSYFLNSLGIFLILSASVLLN